ncbi:Ig domain-containing protein [Nocardioides sp.]|uniref:Ig domain-containing protein n=1 Tax=Nocardioides sp. TaxID=35761 RepID=UPI0035148705
MTPWGGPARLITGAVALLLATGAVLSPVRPARAADAGDRAAPGPPPIPAPVVLSAARARASGHDVAGPGGSGGSGDVTTLHSRPGAPVTVLLDLGGATVSGTAYNTWVGVDPLVATGYDRDGDPSTLDEREQDEVRRAWRYVADKLAPFEVDVTTEEPAPEAMRQSGPEDPTWGLRVLFSDRNELWSTCGPCSGVSYLGVAGPAAGLQELRDSYGLSWVFVPDAATAEDLGAVATIDVGHAAGLRDRGCVTPEVSAPVYAGTELWAPLMGNPYRAATATWSDGSYPGATPVGQDDLALLDVALGRRPDDLPDAPGPGTPAVTPDSSVLGDIGDADDVDVVTARLAGPVTVTVAPVSPTSMLDVDLVVRDADTGAVLGRAAPPTVMAASWAAVGTGASVDVAAGPTSPREVVIEVRGDGNADPRPAGRTGPYSALGRYRVSLTPAEDPQLLRVGRETPLTAAAGTSVVAEVHGVTGGVAPVRTGALETPPGTSFDPYSGSLIGVAPTVPGRYPLRLVVGDAAGTTRVLETALEVTPGPGAGPPQVLPHDPEVLEVGVPVHVQVGATGGTGAITWSAGVLPPGLSLRPDGVFTGSPQAPGESTVSVLATDEAGAQGSGTLALRIEPRLRAVTAATLPAGRAGRVYRATLAVDGGVGPLVWSLRKADPGVRLLPGATPAQRVLTLRLPARTRRQGAGTVGVGVSVVDRWGVSVVRRFTIRVVPAGAG